MVAFLALGAIVFILIPSQGEGEVHITIWISGEEVKKPGVVLLVLDVAGSIKGEKLEQAKQGALKFIDTMSVNNHVGLVTFSSSVIEAVDIGPIAKKKFDLAAVIESAQASGSTALYDATKTAAETALSTFCPPMLYAGLFCSPPGSVIPAA